MHSSSLPVGVIRSQAITTLHAIAGYHSDNGTGLALWGCRDACARYGMGCASKAQKPFEAGATAAQQARDSGMLADDEEPSLVFLIGSPGEEEEVIRGIQSVFGEKVRLLGASSADNSADGGGYQVHRICRVPRKQWDRLRTH